jgi:hypothetical protein
MTQKGACRETFRASRRNERRNHHDKVGIDADWPRFWLTKSGVPLLYLPPRGLWPSDVDHKVVHHPTPRSGWDRYDHLYLHDEADVEYALKILADLESVNN